LQIGEAKRGPNKRAAHEETKGGENMNVTMGDLVLVVVQSIAIASVAGWVFYCLLTWVA
jgi:hypothetical protein